jgi:hypothetical protein
MNKKRKRGKKSGKGSARGKPERKGGFALFKVFFLPLFSPVSPSQIERL